ncbi:MAG: efflux transporter outer membrane subunit [Pigmentiphaga sp.]
MSTHQNIVSTKSKHARFLLPGLMALLTACATAPTPPPLSPELSAAYQQVGPWRLAEPTVAASGPATWRLLGDASLDRWLAELDAGNLDIVQAEARYRQARALVDRSRAALWPRLDAGAGLSRGASDGAGVASRYVADLTLAWTPDLWGKASGEIDAAGADARAQAAARAGVQLLAEAEFTRQYLRIRVLDEQAEMLRLTEQAYDRSLELTRNQYEAGLVARSDVALAEAQLASVRVQLAQQTSTRAALEHALAVLLGRLPGDFALEPGATVPAPPRIPAGVPSALLERRPDVVQAEQAVAAANARLGVARAAWFPDLTLGASGGLQSATLGQWLSAPAWVWSLGPALAATLLDGGARGADQARALAVYDETAAAYRQTVLVAIREVEDALAALATLDIVITGQRQVVALAEEAEALIRNQYAAGMVSFLDVAVAQNSTLGARRDLLDRLGARLDATVALIAATGGGWQRGDAP